MPALADAPVLIVGAGLVGLTLAQGLKKEGIPFRIFERDEGIDARYKGWGVTIHWALPALESCLSPELFREIDSTQVDPEQGLNDKGRFLFLDISTAQPKFVIPPAFRRRVSRQKLRGLLARGLDVEWGKSIVGYSCTENGVSVSFDDGTKADGSLLVGAEGIGSRTRSLLVGAEPARPGRLPVNFMGLTIRLTEEGAKPLREIDPLMFQGSHPKTGYYMWFSFLSTPQSNGSATEEDPYYEGQINISWLATDPDNGVPASQEARLAKMRDIVRAGGGFHETLRLMIEQIPKGTEVLELKLADWAPSPWTGGEGRITLAGDAAHPMTMYRGEGANHGLTDAARLKEQLLLWHRGSKSSEEAIADYEAEMIARGYEAVLLSRQACLDAHDLQNLTADSPTVSKRARILRPGVKA